MNRAPNLQRAPSDKEKMQDQQNFLKKCMKSGVAICSIVNDLSAGCIVHRPSYYCNFTYLVVDV